MRRFEDPGDEFRDDEYPDEGFTDDEEEFDTIRCAHCGADIYEDSVQCPTCGEYLTSDTRPLSGYSWLFIVLGILGMLATVLVLLAS